MPSALRIGTVAYELSFRPWLWHPIWALVRALTVPLPIKLLAYDLGKQQRIAQSQDPAPAWETQRKPLHSDGSALATAAI